MDEDWISTGEAARRLGLRNSESIRRYIKEGRIRAQVLTGDGRVVYRIRAADLRAFEQRYLKDSITDEWES
jgi:excisionase family DNA binding protein